MNKNRDISENVSPSAFEAELSPKDGLRLGDTIFFRVKAVERKKSGY